jgi:predicted kinase
LAEEAARRLAGNQSVIVDASFASLLQRDKFRELAHMANVPRLVLWMTCPEATLRERLQQRRNDPSDGRPELLDEQKKHFQPPDRETDVLPVDTGREVAYNVQRIICHLAERTMQEKPT